MISDLPAKWQKCGYVSPRIVLPNGDVQLASLGGCSRVAGHDEASGHCWTGTACDYPEHNDAQIQECELGHRWCDGKHRVSFMALVRFLAGRP